MNFFEFIANLGDIFSRLAFLENENKKLRELLNTFEDRKDKRFDVLNDRLDELENHLYSLDEIASASHRLSKSCARYLQDY